MSFIEQVLRMCHTAACFCSSTLLAATLCAWLPPLSEYPELTQYPILEVDVQEYAVGTQESRKNNDNIPGGQNKSLLTLFECVGCGEELRILCAMADEVQFFCNIAVEYVVCLAQVCSTRKSHLLRLRSAQDESLAGYLLPANGAKSCDVLRIAGGAFERSRSEDRNLTLGFTLEFLLSNSWWQYGDHGLTPPFRLCEDVQDGQTKFRVCNEPSRKGYDNRKCEKMAYSEIASELYICPVRRIKPF
ncbi:hypothetical protein DE146DRAFT_16102 [Phaeosphaeria sp. MPI-PUGE-AT-0046c]|nr:hypothetical protein DE146DRAFT_16102 [Phaeosphaeria sp. MPI-PUGE-AT-0046c]